MWELSVSTGQKDVLLVTDVFKDLWSVLTPSFFRCASSLFFPSLYPKSCRSFTSCASSSSSQAWSEPPASSRSSCMISFSSTYGCTLLLSRLQTDHFSFSKSLYLCNFPTSTEQHSNFRQEFSMRNRDISKGSFQQNRDQTDSKVNGFQRISVWTWTERNKQQLFRPESSSWIRWTRPGANRSSHKQEAFHFISSENHEQRVCHPYFSYDWL